MRTRKLKLNLDQLSVESLVIPAAPLRGGTVRGHVDPQLAGYDANAQYYSDYNDTVYRDTDPSEWNDTVLHDTEWVSCGGTCGTCGGTDCWA